MLVRATAQNFYLDCGDVDKVKIALLNWLAETKDITMATLEKHCYLHDKDSAVSHLFSVISGIDSM